MSVGVVDKQTGDRIPTAGNPMDKVGNLANLTTTAKGSAVEAINEVNAGLEGKQATLTFDSVPTDGSNNPVKSDGIYDALSGKQAVPTEISYADWQQLTPQQQESGSWLVQGVPSANLSTRVSALESGKQDKTDNTLATTTKTVVGAINEVNSNITNNTYKSGDIISATISDGAITTFGFIQHQTQVYVIIPVYKPITATSFTVTDIESFYVRYDGHLVDALANITGLATPTIMSNGLQFTVNFNTGTFNGVEHMPAIFTINAKITFVNS